MLYKNKRLVVNEKHKQIEIIQDIHCGIGQSEHAKAMASHLDKNSTYKKISQRFYWHSVASDVAEFIRGCEQCQRQGDNKLNQKNELNPVPVPTVVLKQIGVDLCSFPVGFHKWDLV